MPSPELLAQAQALVSKSSKILVFSGAGLSKASGVPTYRCPDGLWTKVENTPFSSVAGWHENPAGCLAFWNQLRDQLSDVKPNKAHQALSRLQAAKPDTLLVTQNVDGLMQAAGCTTVYELHGSMQRCKCTMCDTVQEWSAERCPCGGHLRPDVVLFGEMLNMSMVDRLMSQASTVDLVIVVGTSLEVYPAAGIPAMAQDFGIPYIRIDPSAENNQNPPATCYLQGTAEELLPLLIPE